LFVGRRPASLSRSTDCSFAVVGVVVEVVVVEVVVGEVFGNFVETEESLFDHCNLVDSARPYSLQMCDARADVIKLFTAVIYACL
jgi:hypothetical protein